MRHPITCIAFLCLVLAGCGGKGEPGAPTMLQSVAAVVSGNDHTCATPVESGTAAQVACHKAAQAACPTGTAPNRVDFSEENGMFLVRGYSCV